MTSKPDTEGWNEPPAVLLQEQERPGEYIPACEDEHGTYISTADKPFWPESPILFVK